MCVHSLEVNTKYSLVFSYPSPIICGDILAGRAQTMRPRFLRVLAALGLSLCVAGACALASIFLLVLNCGTASAQQGGDVTVIIKAKSNPASLPTLLVMCDLACDWKLDGEVKDHIDAGGSAKVKVEPGQHMVEASTEDGVDQVRQPSTVKPTGQTMVSIELQPIRYARLVGEQEARDAAAQAQAARTQGEREAQEEAVGVWTDPATGLMWTKKDNGSDVGWQQAVDYCRNLQSAGHSDWHLPGIEELQSIYDPSITIPGHFLDGKPLNWHVKGSLKLSGDMEWSNTPGVPPQNPYHHLGEAWLFYFFLDWGKRSSYPIDASTYGGGRALCVRRSGE